MGVYLREMSCPDGFGENLADADIRGVAWIRSHTQEGSTLHYEVRYRAAIVQLVIPDTPGMIAHNCGIARPQLPDIPPSPVKG